MKAAEFNPGAEGRPGDEASLAERSVGIAWPNEVRLLRVDGQAWLIDGEVGRLVTAEPLAGFRLSDARVEDVEASDLDAFMVGPALPPRPVVVVRGGDPYIVDAEPEPVIDTRRATQGPDASRLTGSSCAAAPLHATDGTPFVLALLCLAILTRRR